jgi:hypothetical protein
MLTSQVLVRVLADPMMEHPDWPLYMIARPASHLCTILGAVQNGCCIRHQARGCRRRQLRIAAAAERSDLLVLKQVRGVMQ